MKKSARASRLHPPAPDWIEGLVGFSEIVERGPAQPHRWLRSLVDHGTNAGFAVNFTFWDELWPGDLLGVRVQGATDPRVGAVTSKFAMPEGEGFGVQVDWLAQAPRKLLLRKHSSDPAADRTARPFWGLQAPACRSQQRQSGLIVDVSALPAPGCYELALDARVCEIRLAPASRRGRGWALVPFEMIGIRPREFIVVAA